MTKDVARKTVAYAERQKDVKNAKYWKPNRNNDYYLVSVSGPNQHLILSTLSDADQYTDGLFSYRKRR